MRFGGALSFIFLIDNLQEGIILGQEKGWLEGLEEVARNALAEGATFDFIQKITGLDIETIRILADG